MLGVEDAVTTPFIKGENDAQSAAILMQEKGNITG